MARNPKNSSPTDSLFIEGFEVSCRVGETAEERAFPQIVTLSIRGHLPLKRAGKTDDLKETVDYAAIIEKIRGTIGGKSFVLIEAVAENVADIVLSFHKIIDVEVKATKKSFPGTEGTGVMIFRSR